MTKFIRYCYFCFDGTHFSGDSFGYGTDVPIICRRPILVVSLQTSYSTGALLGSETSFGCQKGVRHFHPCPGDDAKADGWRAITS